MAATMVARSTTKQAVRKRGVVWGVSMTPITFGTGGNGEHRTLKFKHELEKLLDKHKAPSVVTVDEWQ